MGWTRFDFAFLTATNFGVERTLSKYANGLLFFFHFTILTITVPITRIFLTTFGTNLVLVGVTFWAISCANFHDRTFWVEMFHTFVVLFLRGDYEFRHLVAQPDEDLTAFVAIIFREFRVGMTRFILGFEGFRNELLNVVLALRTEV